MAHKRLGPLRCEATAKVQVHQPELLQTFRCCAPGLEGLGTRNQTQRLKVSLKLDCTAGYLLRHAYADRGLNGARGAWTSSCGRQREGESGLGAPNLVASMMGVLLLGVLRTRGLQSLGSILGPLVCGNPYSEVNMSSSQLRVASRTCFLGPKTCLAFKGLPKEQQGVRPREKRTHILATCSVTTCLVQRPMLMMLSSTRPRMH